MGDFLFILGNLHRFVRQRRNPAAAAGTPDAPGAPPGLTALDPRKPGPTTGPQTGPKNSDASFLLGVGVAAAVLLGLIAVFWSLT